MYLYITIEGDWNNAVHLSTNRLEINESTKDLTFEVTVTTKKVPKNMEMRF